MRIELRILSGARSGQSEVFEQQTILVGRKLSNDLRFDAHDDLDVSAKHAEIVERNGRWYVIDKGSTNGTFVNGLPAKEERPLKDGDVIAFGKHGPTVEVRAKGETTGSTPAVSPTAKSRAAKVPAPPPGLSTHERVAVAVREQTRGIKAMLVGSMIGLGAIAIFAYWFGTREGSQQAAEMRIIMAQAESASAALKSKAGAADTSFANALALRLDSLKTRAQATAAGGNAVQIAAVKQEIENNRVAQQGLATLDFKTIFDQNDPAVAFVVTELNGKLYSGTAFCVTKSGLLVTNRHNVRTDSGAQTTRLEVVFANSSIRLPARVVRISEVADEDLALIQIERPGEFPTVSGISASGEAPVGSPVVTIGFSKGLDLQMQGNIMKSSLNSGPVSKHLPTLLQVDLWGTHGLSGAPVFDIRGYVVGVVFGGPKGETAGVVYAVPSDRLVAFMGDLGKSIVR